MRASVFVVEVKADDRGIVQEFLVWVLSCNPWFGVDRTQSAQRNRTTVDHELLVVLCLPTGNYMLITDVAAATGDRYSAAQGGIRLTGR